MYFYHFTDSRNLDSIRERGLLSWEVLEMLGIPHIAGSSSDSRFYDARRNLRNYVRLCRDTSHPMAYRCQYDGRILRLIWLRIDSSVMDLSTTLYSNDNAVKNAVSIGFDPRIALQSLSRQAEIMVLKSIPPELIHFPSSFGGRVYG